MLSKFTDFLKERTTDVVFHFSPIVNAVKILKNDKFLLNKDDIKEHMFFLSTSRTRLGGYHKHERSGVIFTLDGRKLSNTFKAEAIDFFSVKYNSSSREDPEDFEFEDRVYSKKDTIPNASKYILHAGIKLSPSNKQDSKTMKMVKDIISILKKKKIPFYVYTDANAWLTGNKRKALSEDELKELL